MVRILRRLPSLRLAGVEDSESPSAAKDPQEALKGLDEGGSAVDSAGASAESKSAADLVLDPQRTGSLWSNRTTTLLFRWFVGLSVDGPVWNPSTFSKNRDCLEHGRVWLSACSMRSFGKRARKGLTSNEAVLDAKGRQRKRYATSISQALREAQVAAGRRDLSRHQL